MTEMVLMLLLVLHGWRIHRRVTATANAPMAKIAARWSLVSLMLCVLGDLVNRNFLQHTFAYDTTIEHSYLADSVWCFLPGYLLWVCLAWQASTPAVGPTLKFTTLTLAGAAGLVSWYALLLPGTHAYILGMTGAYSLVVTAMVPAGVWLLLSLGHCAWHVASGAILATIADALIAQFWLFGHGHYPDIAHLNFVVYFASQALIQQLPLVLMRSEQVGIGSEINAPGHVPKHGAPRQ